MAARAGAALDPRRRELDPGRGEAAQLRVAGIEARSDAAPGHLEVLHPAVRGEQGAQPLVVDAGHKEVGVRRRAAQDLVAHRAADEVGVDPEPAHEVFDPALHAAILPVPGP